MLDGPRASYYRVSIVDRHRTDEVQTRRYCNDPLGGLPRQRSTTRDLQYSLVFTLRNITVLGTPRCRRASRIETPSQRVLLQGVETATRSFRVLQYQMTYQRKQLLRRT